MTPRAWALGLALGAAGGATFAALNLPLPWMLGSLSACSVAALSGWQPAMPLPLRAVMLAVLGSLLGSAFTPDLVDRVGQWSITLAVLLSTMAATTLAGTIYLRRTAGMSTVTAFFASAPGGISEMVTTGGAMGGDERSIALSHALRILFIVFAVPIGFRLVTGVHGRSLASTMGTWAQLAAMDGLALLACAAAGAAVGRLIRMPAAMLTGPMIATALVHLLGWSTARPPSELVIVAQVVTGGAIGCRFAGMSWGALAGGARLALGTTLITLAACAGAAAIAAVLSGQPFGLILLAFVPGGIAEMCLIALALGQDVAFVSTHHVVRVMMIIMLAPLLFRTILKVRKDPP